jgi:hypothetical protein
MGCLQVGGGWYGDLSHGCFLRRLYVPVNGDSHQKGQKEVDERHSKRKYSLWDLTTSSYISLVPPTSTS